MSFRILGVKIDGFSVDETVRKGGWIVTANPEILVYADEHPEYAEALTMADATIVDGFGLYLACLFKGRSLRRVTGVELSEALIKKAAHERLRVALIGGKNPQTADNAAKYWENIFPQLEIRSWHGGRVGLHGQLDAEGVEAISELKQFKPDLILLALGHPRQEYVIAQHREEWSFARYVVGVGGTFEFWTGEQRRAPTWMQYCGLEWAFRWYHEPHRWKRMLTALVVFPYRVLKESFFEKKQK